LEENTMNRRQASTSFAWAALSFGALGMRPLAAQNAHVHDHAEEEEDAAVRGPAPASVTVSFGAGLNTAQPGNSANHHVLPRFIRVRKNGVVNFVVAGFHQVMVYEPGVRPKDIVLPPETELFINDENKLFYRGLAPAGGPPPETPATVNPSNAVNRVESVSFPKSGTWLVLCNVRPHFVDGMYAFVRVV
jgi:hypothetical protein